MLVLWRFCKILGKCCYHLALWFNIRIQGIIIQLSLFHNRWRIKTELINIYEFFTYCYIKKKRTNYFQSLIHDTSLLKTYFNDLTHYNDKKLFQWIFSRNQSHRNAPPPRTRRLHAVPWFTLDSTAITRLDQQEKRELNERNGETIKRNCPNVVDRGGRRRRQEKGVRRDPPPRDIHHVCGSQGRPSPRTYSTRPVLVKSARSREI